jgi:hypothetical protein
MRKGQLRVIPCSVEDLESVGTIVRIDKDVKILGMADDTGIVCQGIPAAYETRHPGCL